MQNLNHPHLMHAIYVEVENNTVNIVQPLAKANLYDFVRKTGTIDAPTIMKWSRQIIDATKFLHERKIVHGDIKAKNVLLFNDNDPNDFLGRSSKTRNEISGWDVKLTDFSLSNTILDSEIEGMAYTHSHRPPEVWKNEKWCYPADVWAIGCTIYEMCYVSTPFPQQKISSSEIKEQTIRCHQTLHKLGN